MASRSAHDIDGIWGSEALDDPVDERIRAAIEQLRGEAQPVPEELAQRRLRDMSAEFGAGDAEAAALIPATARSDARRPRGLRARLVRRFGVMSLAGKLAFGVAVAAAATGGAVAVEQVVHSPAQHQSSTTTPAPQRTVPTVPSTSGSPGRSVSVPKVGGGGDDVNCAPAQPGSTQPENRAGGRGTTGSMISPTKPGEGASDCDGRGVVPGSHPGTGSSGNTGSSSEVEEGNSGRQPGDTGMSLEENDPAATSDSAAGESAGS